MEAGVGGFACSWWMQGLCKGCTEGWGPRGHCAGPAWPWMYDSTVREMILKLRPKNVAATDTQMGRLQPPRRPRICYLYVPVLQHTHTHTLTHVCTHTPMHTHTHAHRHTCTHMHTSSITHTLMHTRTPHILLLSPCPSSVLSPHDLHSALRGQDPCAITEMQKWWWCRLHLLGGPHMTRLCHISSV